MTDVPSTDWAELRLACWCNATERCHADVWLKITNGTAERRNIDGGG